MVVSKVERLTILSMVEGQPIYLSSYKKNISLFSLWLSGENNYSIDYVLFTYLRRYSAV
jgi:hypothetical protein